MRSDKSESSVVETEKESFIERLVSSFGMIILGIVLDLADLATFGAWGLYLGALVGGSLGLYLAYALRWGWKGQSLMAFVGASYCMLPATELLPAATFVFAVAQFFKNRKKP